MSNYCDNLKNRVAKLFVISLIFTQVSGCHPTDNKGDLSVKASAGSSLKIGDDNDKIAISIIYGSEYGHPDPRKSDIRSGHLNLLVSLYVFLPKGNDWEYVGGGTGENPLFPGLFYNHNNWLLNPFMMYAIRNNKGIADLENKKTFSWGFDGKNRTIKIDNKKYPISAGDYVLVKLNSDWKPEVWVGEIGFNKLVISSDIRNKIIKCHEFLKEGIHATGKCK